MGARGAAERPLRADAARNRERVLSAAADVFAQRGLTVTLDDIAAHAGVGVGTIYRRFGHRDAVVAAVFGQRLQQVTERMRHALQAPDAWGGLVECLWQTCADFADDRGMRQALLSGAYSDELAVRCRNELHELSAALVERAQGQGLLRPDVVATDIPMVLVLVSSVADFAGSQVPALWRRYLQMLLDGMLVERASYSPAEQLEVPMSQEDFIAASRTWQPGGRGRPTGTADRR